MKFEWNPNLYDKKHDFVHKYGEEIVNLLNPQPEETILDLGCGTGDLTKKISELCKKVVGLDNSIEMIQTSQKKYHELAFINDDANDFHLNYNFNAVFSNAVLHWVPNAEKTIQNINSHLKIGGRFVAEFGGKGCVNNIIGTLCEILDNNQINYPKIADTLYYPSVGEYAGLLEQNGFEVNLAALFDRPTELKGGLDGLNSFIEMFFPWLFKNVIDNKKAKIIEIVNDTLKPEMYNGYSWIADYRRIRIVAFKKFEF